MEKSISEAAPIACTLEARDFKERLAWIADLNRGALLASRRNDLRLELSYAPHALEDVRELMRREQQCCAFLDFEVCIDDAVRLVVTAPEEAREAAELVFEPLLSMNPLASSPSCGCNSGCAE